MLALMLRENGKGWLTVALGKQDPVCTLGLQDFRSSASLKGVFYLSQHYEQIKHV